MARNKTKSSPVLPGLSRSAACTKTKSCGRLAGHRSACRATLNRAQSAKPTEPTLVLSRKVSAEGRTWLIEVWSDGSTKSSELVESPAPDVAVETKSRSPRRTSRRTKSVGQCRVVKAGTRCSRAYGHKQAGTRHSFAVVTQLPDATAEGRDRQVVRGKSSRRRGYVASGKPSSRLA